MNSLSREDIVFNILEGIFSDIEIEENENFNKFPRTINSITFVEKMNEKEALELINSVNYKKNIQSIDNKLIDYHYNSDQFLNDFHKITPPSFMVITLYQMDFFENIIDELILTEKATKNKSKIDLNLYWWFNRKYCKIPTEINLKNSTENRYLFKRRQIGVF